MRTPVHADICNIKSRHTFDPYFRVIVTETAPVIADSRDWEAAENSRLTWDGPPASQPVCLLVQVVFMAGGAASVH